MFYGSLLDGALAAGTAAAEAAAEAAAAHGERLGGQVELMRHDSRPICLYCGHALLADVFAR